MGRSSGRPGAGRRGPRPSPPAVPAPTARPSLASAVLSRVWQGVTYRPLEDPGRARALFDFAAMPWPDASAPTLAWGASVARDGAEAVIGAVVAERAGRAAMLHGPVVVTDENPLEVAAQLVGALLDHVVAAGAQILFARPQGLDRVWTRFGFIPVPEETLAAGLSAGAQDGLYAWRDGRAVWSLRELTLG